MTVTLAIVNADIRPMTGDGQSFQALAVSGQQITALGTDPEIRALCDAQTRIIDIYVVCAHSSTPNNVYLFLC